MERNMDIWVVINDTQAEDRRTGFELLTPGRILADQACSPLTAVVIGMDAGETARKAIALGADHVWLLDSSLFARYDTDCYCHALAALVEQHRPGALLLPATEQGRDLAPRLACRFQTGLTADCTEIALQPDGETIAWTRPALGGNLMATIVCQNHRPQMGTVRPGVFSQRQEEPQRTGTIVPIRDFPDLPLPRVQLLRKIQNVFSGEALESSDIIVAGGLGMGSKENFQWIHRLAAALGGSVGASRGAVQEGWAPYAYQVGQSGRTVRPKVYIACGISGAIQHLAGISGAECVIAINSDPEAPIFQAANYGIIGDVLQILPELLRLCEETKL